MKKFSENQVFTNFLKTHPRLRADFHSGNAYYNDRINEGQNISSGSLSLYEINVDRASDELVYPFVTKDAAKNSFSVTSKATYNALNPGATISGTYPLTSSISRQYPMSTSYKSALKNTLNYYKYLSPSYTYENYDNEAVKKRILEQKFNKNINLIDNKYFLTKKGDFTKKIIIFTTELFNIPTDYISPNN